MNTEEQIKLSIIYVGLLRDLDDTPNFQQKLQLVSDAVDAACAVKDKSKDLHIDLESDRGWSLVP